MPPTQNTSLASNIVDVIGALGITGQYKEFHLL